MENTSNKNDKSQNTNGGSQTTKVTATDLRSLFKNVLKDIYWVEKTLTNEIPRMINKSTSEELKSILASQLRITEDHTRIL